MKKASKATPMKEGMPMKKGTSGINQAGYGGPIPTKGMPKKK
jgi:hypothetical protein